MLRQLWRVSWLGSSRGLRLSASAGAVHLKMPSLSPTMETGTIVAWNKKEGDPVGPGDVICEIQTDKAVMAFEVDDEGTLAKILSPEGTADIPVGQPIAVLAEDGEDWKSVEIPAASAPSSSAAASPSTPPSPAAAPPSGPSRNDVMGPAVRLLLSQHNLDPTKLTHSGPHGLLLKGDVLAHIAGTSAAAPATAAAPPPPKPTTQLTAKVPAAKEPPAAQTSSDGGYTDIPLTSMRKTIAKRLTQSKQQSPHAYASIDVDIAQVNIMRKELKDEGVKVSVNDFIVKAVAAALRAVPSLNIRISSDGESVSFVADASVSVAVATPAGLITPIVPHADTLSVSQISEKIRELAGRAKDNKLAPEEFIGGSCTVSNLGMYGIGEFTAIINPPQAAILAVGGLRGRVGVDGQPRSEVRITLCFDQRGVSETAAAEFLAVIRDCLADPTLMLLGVPVSRPAREDAL